MLGWRLAISAALVPLLLLLFWWDSSSGSAAAVLLLFCLLLTIRSAFEMSALLLTRNIRTSFELCAACNFLIIIAAWTHVRLPGIPTGRDGLLLSLGIVAAALMASLLLIMMFEAARYRQPGQTLESLGANLLTVMYTGGLLAV